MSLAEPPRLTDLFGGRASRPSITVFQYYQSDWVGSPSCPADWIKTILRDRPRHPNEYLIVIGLRQDHLVVGSQEQRNLAAILDDLLTNPKTGSATTSSHEEVFAILGSPRSIAEWVQNRMPRVHSFANELQEISADLKRADRWYFFGDLAHFATPDVSILCHLDDLVISRLADQLPRDVKTLGIHIRVNADRITDRITSLKQEVIRVLDQLEFPTTYAGEQLAIENRSQSVSIRAMGVALAVEVCHTRVMIPTSHADSSGNVGFAQAMMVELSRLRGDAANDWLNGLREELMNVVSDRRTTVLAAMDSFIALSAGLTGDGLIRAARQLERMCELNHCVLTRDDAVDALPSSVFTIRVAPKRKGKSDSVWLVALDIKTEDATPVEEFPRMRVMPLEALNDRDQETVITRWRSILLGRRIGKQFWSSELASLGGRSRADALADPDKLRIAAAGAKAKGRRNGKD